LRRVVDFEAIPLKVPHEVSGTQAVRTRFMLLRVCWCRRCLFSDVVVALPNISCVLTCGWSNCSEFLLPMSSSAGVGVLALHVLFISFSILRWYIRRDDQDLAV
jgi:hypothetical protein